MIAGKPFALARDASDLVGECYELIGRRAELASPSITGRTDAYQDLLLKVTPPRLPRNLVPRKRLTTTANALGDASVLLVQAPAGFGKTSLLAQWRKEIQSTGVAVAWLSAHTRDDPHRLVQALTLAVRVASGKAAFGQAAFEFDGDDRLENVTVFLAELAQSAQELVLIIHEADKLPEASREALNYLLRQAPQNLHTVVAARPDWRIDLDDLVATASASSSISACCALTSTKRCNWCRPGPARASTAASAPACMYSRRAGRSGCNWR